MNKLAKNYILNLIYELVAIFVPLLTAPYLTRILHSENYGIYSYVQSVTAIISSLTLLGVYSYGNRQIAYCRDNLNEISNSFWELMVLRGVLGFVGTIIYFGFALISKYTVYFLLYYAYFFAIIIDCSWIFVGMENMLPCVLKNIAAKLLTFAGIFIFVKTEADVWKYVVLVATGPFVANISVYTQLHGIIKKPNISWERISEHLKGSFFLYLPQIASLLYLQMDKAMIEGMTGGTSQVSFYDQAEKIVTIALSCVTALSTVMMPRIANEYKKGNKDRIAFYINKSAKYSLAMAAPMTIGLMCVATHLIPWYLGNEYMATAYAIIAISPITISNALMGISGKQYFIATNKVKILTISNFAAAGVNLLINALLIPQYGYMGAAIATLIASYTNVSIQFIALNKYIKIKEVLNGSMRYIIFSGLMGAVILIETKLLGLRATVSTTVVQVLTGIFIYIGCLIILKDEVALFILGTIKKMVRRHDI
jgi:O-antigen/teichoic acid export membrane protein